MMFWNLCTITTNSNTAGGWLSPWPMIARQVDWRIYLKAVRNYHAYLPRHALEA